MYALFVKMNDTWLFRGTTVHDEFANEFEESRQEDMEDPESEVTNYAVLELPE